MYIQCSPKRARAYKDLSKKRVNRREQREDEKYCSWTEISISYVMYLKICVRAYMPGRALDLHENIQEKMGYIWQYVWKDISEIRRISQDLCARVHACASMGPICMCLCVDVCVYMYVCVYMQVCIERERESAHGSMRRKAHRWEKRKKRKKKGGKVSSPAIFTAVIPDRTAQARCSAAQTPPPLDYFILD